MKAFNMATHPKTSPNGVPLSAAEVYVAKNVTQAQCK